MVVICEYGGLFSLTMLNINVRFFRKGFNFLLFLQTKCPSFCYSIQIII